MRSAQDPFPALVSCARVQSTDSGVLQALPEQARLSNLPNLVPSRDNALFAILAHQIAQRVHQLRLRIFEPLIVRAKVDGRIDSASILLYLRFSARPARFMSPLCVAHQQRQAVDELAAVFGDEPGIRCQQLVQELPAPNAIVVRGGGPRQSIDRQDLAQLLGDGGSRS